MLQPGQRLDDYRIIGFFAGGGMAEIYLAEEVSLGRQVAIKVIRPEAIRYPDSEEGRKVTQLFRREATAIARLNNPYILPLYRFGQATVDTIPLMYMVMPYCQEKSLTDWMNTHGKTSFSLQEVDLILRQAAEALQYAHDQGVIHLDIKPSNFLVRYPTDDARKLNLQLADFGIAKFTATTGMSQTVRGSMEYMAPEQWEGQPVFATDQYALAVLIYRLLTGQHPFKGSGFEHLWHQHRYTQPPPPSMVNPGIPPSIDAVLLRALAKNPNDRYPSVQVFADAYRQALESRPTEYAPISQTLTLSPEEAGRGTTRTISLPSGEQLPVMIPPGAYQGQVIPISRQNAPAVIVTIQLASIPPLPPPPPRPTPNRTWMVVLAALAVALIIGGIAIGLVVHNQQQGNAQATATAQSAQTVSLQQTQDAQATLFVQETQTAQPTFPNIQGMYSGSFQFSTDTSSSPMTLDINQQNQGSFQGTCTLGNSSFTMQNGTVDQAGNIQFSISASVNNNNTTLTFQGTAQSSGGWQGNFSDPNGDQGTWSAS